MGQDVVGQNFVRQDVAGAKSLGQVAWSWGRRFWGKKWVTEISIGGSILMVD